MMLWEKNYVASKNVLFVGDYSEKKGEMIVTCSLLCIEKNETDNLNWFSGESCCGYLKLSSALRVIKTGLKNLKGT